MARKLSIFYQRMINIRRCAQCWLAAHRRAVSTENNTTEDGGSKLVHPNLPLAAERNSVLAESSDSLTVLAGREAAGKRGCKLSARAEKNLEALLILVLESLSVLMVYL